MATAAQQGGSDPPPKPWERAAGSSSGPAPFKPPSPGSTSNVVEASGTAKPGEIVSTSNRNPAGVSTDAVGRPLPRRPWENNNYGGYGSSLNYNPGYGSSMYNSYGGGGYGGLYGGGTYNNSMYRGGYGGGMYGSGMYGGGMYNGGLGGSMGGYGAGMGGPGMGMGMGMGGPFGGQDPNNPFGSPPSPPGFWISFLRVMEGVVNFFGRISILVDQNTQAVHLFMSALLQLFDRGGMLYGELARFVLRILGIRTKPKKVPPPGPNGLPFPDPNSPADQMYIDQMAAANGPKPTSGGAWDSVWGNGESK